MKKILYDCDPGIDDALAMILAIKSGIVDLAAVTTVHGNSSLEKTTNNALRLLEYFNQNVPVGIGADKPLRPEETKEIDETRKVSVHGNDGMGDSVLLPPKAKRKPDSKAVDLILKNIKQGVTTIVATGPLTNIAQAFQKDKKTMSSLKELIIMGGVILKPGNIDRLSEVNFYFDPYAAHYVLNQPGIKKVLVPLNVTHKVILTPEHLKKIPDTTSGKLVKSIVRKYQEFYIGNGFLGCALHDPLAMAYAINPGFLKLIPMNIQVERKGEYTKGMCVPELRKKMQSQTRPNVLVAQEVDSKRFLDYFIKTVS